MPGDRVMVAGIMSFAGPVNITSPASESLPMQHSPQLALVEPPPPGDSFHDRTSERFPRLRGCRLLPSEECPTISSERADCALPLDIF